MILNIAITVFIALELSNVLVMYFKPDFEHGNSMSAFAEWGRSENDEKKHLFNKNMVRWVANCKLIFIMLLLVLMLFGDDTLKVYGVAATIISIGIYFLTLHGIIKKLDALGEIKPQGYSKTLGLMIGGFMLMFSLALLLHFLFRL